MSTSKTVTRQFSDDFMAVAAHYMLSQLGELEQAKAAARADMANAESTFATLAHEIRTGNV